MKFYGYKAMIACSADWVQVRALGNFWDIVTDAVGYDGVVGLGMEWTGDEFTYAMGSFDKSLAAQIPECKLREKGFAVEYVEIDLPDEDEWQTFTGRADDLRKICEEQVDDRNRKYDYELEFFDGKGGVKIMIHYSDVEENEYRLFLKKTPEDGKFHRVHAVIVTHDGRILLRYKNGEARITGGRIDAEDMDLESALRWEVLEELDCEIDKIEYLGYLEVEMRKYYDEIGLDCENVREKENWARMVARVTKILPPKADPDREGNWVYGRTLAPAEIAKEELAKSAPMGDTDKLVDYALKVAREKEYFTEVPNEEYEVLNVETHN